MRNDDDHLDDEPDPSCTHWFLDDYAPCMDCGADNPNAEGTVIVMVWPKDPAPHDASS